MSSRQRHMAIRSDINKQGWQTSDFPVACDKCYGANPYMRMLKQNYGQQCRICFRPFTVFKWKGNLGVYKRTCICQFCSKQKNLCQVCTLDLQFGLPIEVRDKRCGVNGKYLLDSNFESIQNQKFKPPPPSCPPPQNNKSGIQQKIYIPQESSEEQNEQRQKQEILSNQEKQQKMQKIQKMQKMQKMQRNQKKQQEDQKIQS